MRGVRRALVAAAVVLVLVVGVDVASRLFAQDWVAGRLQDSLDLSEEPSVTIGGLLFLPAFVTGELPSVQTTGRTFMADGVEFERITLNLRGVSYSPRQLVVRAAGTIRAAEGDGSVTMTDEQLTAAFRSQGVPVDVRFEQGVVRVSSDLFPGSLGARVAIEGGNLVVTPADVPIPVSFTLDLPEFLEGLTYTSVDVRDGIGTLRFDLRDVEFRVDASRG
jgi:hypothetical protein